MTGIFCQLLPSCLNCRYFGNNVYAKCKYLVAIQLLESEDIVKSKKKKMENVLKRFPHLGGLILDNLDNTSLITCKKARRDVSEFLEKEKLIGLRVLRKYHRNFDKFKEL